MLQYIVNGQPYNVKPEHKEMFESQHEGFKLVGDTSTVVEPEDQTSVYNVDGQQYSVKPEHTEAFKKQFDITDLNKHYDDSQNRKQDFNHISKEDFLEVLEGGWLGREEKMVPKLRRLYKNKVDGTESGIEFEETGIGNSVFIKLKGAEHGQAFPLPSSIDDPAEAKQAYIDITEYIESKERKGFGKVVDNKFVEDPKVEKDFHNIFKAKGWERTQYGQVLDITRDVRIAKEINLLFGDDKIQAEAANLITDAVKITLPNGNSRVFNIGMLGDQKGPDKILHFIKSNPRPYSQTKTHKKALKPLDNEIEKDLKRYSENPELALNLFSLEGRSDLKKHISNRLGVSKWQQMFFVDNEEFQDLSRDEKDELIDRRIDEVVDNATDIITNKLAHQEYKDLEAKGYDEKQIKESIAKSVKAGMTPIQQAIFVLNKAIDNADLKRKERS